MIVKGSLVEEVRHLPSIAAFGKRGRLNISKMLGLVADTYKISKNLDDYEFIVLKALYADEPNSNGDAFPLEELERFDEKYGCKVYETFIGKPHFIEHNQNGPAYGFVLDAHLEKPQNETAYVELVIAVDMKKDPIYAAAVRKGNRKYSMGCTVSHTVCSVCKNKAATEKEFCEHIARGKMRTYKVADESGQEKEVIAFERCGGTCYDEISDVGDPAEARAREEERLKAASTKKTFAQDKKADSYSVPSLTFIPPENDGAVHKKRELTEMDYPEKLTGLPKDEDWKKSKGNKMSDDAQDFISKKIKKLVAEGKPQDQAIAIAYSMAKQKGYKVPEKKGTTKQALYVNDTVKYMATGAVGKVVKFIKDLRTGKERPVVQFKPNTEGVAIAPDKLELVRRGRKAQNEPEEGWMMNLSQDVQQNKTMKDEMATDKWFNDRYHRPPTEDEKNQMRELTSKNNREENMKLRKPVTNLRETLTGAKPVAAPLRKAQSILQKLGNDTNYYKWKVEMRKAGFSAQEIDKIEAEGVKHGLWNIMDGQKSNQKPASTPAGKRREPMKERVYFIKQVDSKNPLIKHAQYKGWKMIAKTTPRGVVASLTNGKATPFAKLLNPTTEESKFASAVLTDLVKAGMKFVVDKYAFSPRNKSVLSGPVVDMTTGHKPNNSRITEKPMMDKDKFKDNILGDDITDKAVLDKSEKDPKNSGLSSPKLSANPVRKPVLTGKAKLATVVNASKLLAELHKMYRKHKKMGNDEFKVRFIAAFAPKLTVDIFKGRRAEDAITQNVEQIDVPGMADEILDFYVTDEGMKPADAADTFVTQFVDEKAKDEVLPTVEDMANEVTKEEAPKEKAEEKDEGKPEEKGEPKSDAPSMDEMGVDTEATEVTSAKIKSANELYIAKFRRALKLAANRQLLNLETQGLFEIKASFWDVLTTPNPQMKFAGLSDEVARPIIEIALKKAFASEAVDQLLASAVALTETADEAFAQLEADAEKMSTKNPPLKPGSGSGRPKMPVIARTGTDLLGDESAISNATKHRGNK